MITKELIQANAVFSTLSDEQINAIVTLSQNDENAVIAKRIGEIYGGLDADILTASGISKNGTEKTFDYAKRVIGEIKTAADSVAGLHNQIESLTKEKTRLEKAIAEGSADAETKKALAQAHKDLASVTKSYTDLKSEYDAAKGNHAKEILGLKMDGEFSNALSGIKFKADLPATVVEVIRKQAIEKVKGMFPEYVDDGNGGQRLVFKATENGEVARNPENGLNPYTAAELVQKELTAMGVIDTGRKQQGAGAGADTKPSAGSVDVSAARTQNEAYEAITKTLLSQGKLIGSKDFEEGMQQAWKDNNIQALPIQ